MDKTNNNVKLGAFVIIIFVLFTYMVYRVSGGGGLWNRNLTVYAEFEDVKGLLEGNMVRYSGVNVGKVTDIKVATEEVLSVRMSLDRDVIHYLHSNAKVDIGTNGLVGNVIVNISPGQGTAPVIKNGDTLTVKKTVELTDMMNTLSTTNDKIAQITDALLEITTKINNGSGSVGKLIQDPTLVNHLEQTALNLSTTTQQVKESSLVIEQLLRDVNEGKGNLGYLMRDSSIKTQVDMVSNNLDSLLNDRTEPILTNLKHTSEAIAQSGKELEDIIGNIKEGEGLLGSVIYDSTTAMNLKSSMDNLNQGTQKFDESMEALQHHWLLRGFFKKKEKEAKEKEKNEKK